MFRCDARWLMGQHENRHLEFVVADVRVGSPISNRPSPHEDCPSLLDSFLPVSGVSERRQVGIEATCVAILAGYKPVKRDGHPDDYSCQWLLPVRLCRSSIHHFKIISELRNGVTRCPRASGVNESVVSAREVFGFRGTRSARSETPVRVTAERRPTDKDRSGKGSHRCVKPAMT